MLNMLVRQDLSTCQVLKKVCTIFNIVLSCFDISVVDDDMAEAMRMSLQDLDSAELDRQQGQESGIMFGPATRTMYDSNDWSLVPTEPAPELVQSEMTSKKRRVDEYAIMITAFSCVIVG